MFDVRGFFVKMLYYKQGKRLGFLDNTLRPRGKMATILQTTF